MLHAVGMAGGLDLVHSSNVSISIYVSMSIYYIYIYVLHLYVSICIYILYLYLYVYICNFKEERALPKFVYKPDFDISIINPT